MAMTKTEIRKMHQKQVADWLESANGIQARLFLQSRESLGIELVSLESTGLEEEAKQPCFGGFEDRPYSLQDGIYELMEWFYDGDEQVAEYCH